MRRAVVLLFLVFGVVPVGCDRESEESSRSPEETAQAWVDALNAEDYARACQLSVAEDQDACRKLLEPEPFGKSGLRVEGFYFNKGSDAGNEGTFAISSDADRKPRGNGWTAYAPSAENLRIERHGNEYLIHWEVSVIK